MLTITAAEVNKLRQITGAGMMDCKKALVESEGDFEKAIDFLRKKGQKVAANRSDREAKEGYVLSKVSADAKKGVVFTLSCETDFVAKNEGFQQFAHSLADLALRKNVQSEEDFLGLTYEGSISVQEKITEMIGKIGEKIEISRYSLLTDNFVVAYNHPGNRLATLVALNESGDKMPEVGKDIAMQIAAMSPISIDKDDVPTETLERELEIAREQVRQEGKPEDMVEKIAQGKVNKFYKESTLNNQEFIKDSKKTVAQYLKEVSSGLKVSAFRRVALG
jgi:elongation factor Ts